MSFYRRLVDNHPLANIAFVVVMVMGIAAYLQLPREQDPEINFNWVNITTVLPGASAEDVEKRVTTPLEDAIKGVQDIRFVSSSSRENVSTILVRFHDVGERQFDKRINDLRREIQNKASSELPDEVKNDPQVMEITTNNGFPTAMLLLTGAANDEVLRRNARQLKEDIERLTGVDQVFATGLRNPELQVNFDPQAAQARGVSGGDIADAVGGWFRDTFAGKVEAGEGAGHNAWLVRVVGQQANPDYLARLTVTPAGQPQAQVPLDAVAEVARGRAAAGSLASWQGQPAVMLSVTKKSYTNTLELVSRIQTFIDQNNPRLTGQGVKLHLLDDQTVPTREAIGIMESNALIGLSMVLLVSWVFLGTRIALLVAIGVPFSLAGTFALLQAAGFTLNVSVLLGVVIVLGMLVDDAVVVVEAIYYRLQHGQNTMDAIMEGVAEVAAPVTASVLTTMSAFLPLMLLPGIVGKFMFVIPFVVTVGLAVSLFEAFWMLPAHVSVIRPDFSAPGRMQRWRFRFSQSLRVRYGLLLVKVLRRPRLWLTCALLLVVAAGTAVGAGAVRVQFFAFDPLRIFYVNIDMPAGAPIDATLARAEEVERRVSRHLKPGEARSVAAYAGVKFTDTEPLYGEAYGQVVVSLLPREPGGREVGDIVNAMRRDIESLPGAGKTSFTLLSGGPPVSKPVKVRVRGDNPEQLRHAADELLALLRALPGTRDVVDDDVPGRPGLKLVLNDEALRAAGLNPAQIARLIRLHADGEIVAVMRDAGDKIEVRVRARHDGPEGRHVGNDILRLLDDPIPLPGGRSTTLGALTHAETDAGRGVIKHYNLRRAITVEADLDKTVLDTVEANRKLLEGWRQIAARYPGVDLDFSGELDDIQESLDAMLLLFLFGIGLIYLILATQFRHYWQPLLILCTVPMAFTGVVSGLLVSGNPMSLYTLYGVIALTGIAVNAAIVLIDATNDRRSRGMSVLHAAVYAARRRVVPIVITSATTVGGLFSLAFGLAGKSLLWGPVAGAIVWGLGVSTLLTLFVVPLLYCVTHNRRQRAV